MQTRRLAHVLPLLALLVSQHALAQSAPAAATPQAESSKSFGDTSVKQEAARRFEHAIKLYEEADYALALAEFERVYELVPDYRVLYNIGQVSIQMGRYARAYRTLKEYVARGGAELAPDRAAAVQADLTLLSGKVARVSLQVEQAGAQLSVDGVAVGRSPLAEPLVVDVGEHRLQVELAGYVTQSRSLTLAGGDRREVAFTLQATPSAAPTTAPLAAPREQPRVTPPEPANRTSSTRGTWLGVGWGTTGALAAGALVSGALGASAAGDLRDLRGTAGTSRQALEQAQSRASTRLLVADVLGGAALATGAVTLYFQLSGSSHEKAPNQAAVSQWRLLLGPSNVALRFED
ncbi:MAG TPA: PEGA domain-containing protein [Polyangiaceae bacterium]|nr:PEGA domain-containing protein [Polyangiaceae bacterium]